MDIQGLRSSLERLFDLPGLHALSRDYLALEPTEIGGSEDLTSFARALTFHCAHNHRLDALWDAALVCAPEARASLLTLREWRPLAGDPLQPGDMFGSFQVREHLGTGATGNCYRAILNDRSVRLKVMHPHATVNLDALHRLQTQTRLLQRLGDCGLPRLPQAGVVGEQCFIAHEWLTAETVAHRLQKGAAEPLPFMRDLLAALLVPVIALHDAGLAAACVKPGNVLLVEGEHGLAVTLLDVGTNLLLGLPTSFAHDFHDIGALIHELLTGALPTVDSSANPQLGLPIKPPSTVGHATFNAPAVDRLILDLLRSSVGELNFTARSLRDAVLQLDLTSGESQIPEQEVQARIEALCSDPLRAEALADLEQALAQGADRARVGKALLQAAEAGSNAQPGGQGALHLYTRAAEVLANAGSFGDAELALQSAMVIDPTMQRRGDLFERICRGLHKFDSLIEALLERSEAETSKPARAALLEKIATIYDRDVHDQEQALVAYTQALCEDPTQPQYAANVERIAGQSLAHWEEILLACAQATAQLEPIPGRVLLLHVGKWYTRLAQIDLAISCYKAVLEQSASDVQAFAALAHLYRDRQQWPELHSLLLAQIQQTIEPHRESSLRFEAAEIAELRLNDAVSAQRGYAQVLALEPPHTEAYQALLRIHEHSKDYSGLVGLLRHRAQTQRGAEATALYCRAADHCINHLADHAQAQALYQAALEQDAKSLPALLGLDAEYTRQKQFAPLVENLKQQLDLIETPRQRIDLFSRLASLYEQEFLDPERALLALESVLQLAPSNPEALAALARLRESAGDSQAALEAILALAEKSQDPSEKLAHTLHAARLYLGAQAFDKAGAQFRHILDLDPNHPAALEGLREVQLALGDWRGAAALIEQQLARAEGNHSKARLSFELATLLSTRSGAMEAAGTAARRAVELDPTLGPAWVLAGDIAYESGQYREATSAFQKVLAQSSELMPEVHQRVLLRQIDALCRTDSASAAVDLVEPLLSAAPYDVEVMKTAASLSFAHGSPDLAARLCLALLTDHASSLDPDQVALWTFRLGESQRRAGTLALAITTLEEATDLDPDSPAPLESLALAQAAEENWAAVIRSKERLLDLTEGPARADLLIEIGDILSAKLNDRARAVKSFTAALEAHPDNRKLLTRLMALYSESREWLKLLEVVHQLAALVDNAEQKAKYLLTAAMVCQRELDEGERAAELYAQVINLDPSNQKAREEALKLFSALRRFDAVEQLLTQNLEQAQKSESTADLLASFLALGSLYKDQLQQTEAAIDAFEAALTLDPQNTACVQALSELYGTSTEKYGERFTALHLARVHHDPFQADPYKQLRRLYTELRRADSAWGLCQVLNALGLSSADEDQFYERLRSDSPAALQEPLSNDDWQSLIHPDTDQLITGIFSALEGIVIAGRTQSLEELGYAPEAALDLSQATDSALHVVVYTAQALGFAAPEVFDGPHLSDTIVPLPSDVSAVALGLPLLDGSVSSQASVFAATRALCLLQPGFRVRQLLTSGTGLKSWLLAAVKLNSPTFPVPAELVGPVNEAFAAIQSQLTPQAKDELMRLVAKLLQGASELNLRKWVAAIDFTIDRVGFLLSNDLKVATDSIANTAASEMAPAPEVRLRELIFFAVSENYFELRKRLHVSIDG